MHEILMGRELALLQGRGLRYNWFFYVAVEIAWKCCYHFPSPLQALSMHRGMSPSVLCFSKPLLPCHHWSITLNGSTEQGIGMFIQISLQNQVLHMGGPLWASSSKNRSLCFFTFLEDLGTLWFACWRLGWYSLSVVIVEFLENVSLLCKWSMETCRANTSGSSHLLTTKANRSWLFTPLDRQDTSNWSGTLNGILSPGNLYNWRLMDSICLSERHSGSHAALSDVNGDSNSSASSALGSC